MTLPFGRKRIYCVTGCTVLLFGSLSAIAQNDYFRQWPVGLSPREIGEQLSAHFVTSPHQYGPTIHYSEVATWYGALTYSHLTHDDRLRSELIQRFHPLLPGGSEAALIPMKHHVDDSVFGVVPLEIAIQTGDLKYLAYGKGFADRQWQDPSDGGLSNESRFWIDDMYMISILQLEAYRATKDRSYLDREAREMTAYLDKLQQPNGLFYHSPDSQFFWGRGDGWVAAGMAETLNDLPLDHPQRARIIAGYRLMMAALVRYQGSDGMWRQLIDRSDAWPEASSSAMFAFALITGVKEGWLEPSIYGQPARRAWIAVAGYVDQNQNVTIVCEGTNKGHDVDYYLSRRRKTGDFHGQAPLLWAASALLR